MSMKVGGAPHGQAGGWIAGAETVPIDQRDDSGRFQRLPPSIDDRHLAHNAGPSWSIAPVSDSQVSTL
jgi:hypothetical protein